ncbi:MAG: redox-regulated ATPase YchF [Candidatus Margulisbacteria bacterium]|nr:redox-regulated ATPase YchF [Candidatus Margulisiibacteriota bacterium]
MGFSLGIIGLPNVGKSTLFNVLSTAKAEVSNYPFCTINPNVGVVTVPDERLLQVQKIMGSKKAIPTVIEFYDIAGLVKGAHQGEGLGNQFLAQIREVDAVAHVVRCFASQEIAHVSGQVNPTSDIETINVELCLADLVLVEKRLEEARNKAKAGDKKHLKQADVLQRLKAALEKGQPARQVKLVDNEKDYLNDLPLLTLKPVLYVANTDESGNLEQVEQIKQLAQATGDKVVSVCAKLETEIAELAAEDAQAFLKEMGLTEAGLSRLIRTAYELLNLITIFTANQKETRAWTVAQGTKVPQAAGKIHSDMEQGFIAAEVVHYQDLVSCGSYAGCREKGDLHTEGKNYAIQDGDLILVKFVV